jgi:hypothetical protein
LRPYIKNTHHKKRAGEMAQNIGPVFKSQHHKKRREGGREGGREGEEGRKEGESAVKFIIIKLLKRREKS